MSGVPEVNYTKDTKKELVGAVNVIKKIDAENFYFSLLRYVPKIIVLVCFLAKLTFFGYIKFKSSPIEYLDTKNFLIKF